MLPSCLLVILDEGCVKRNKKIVSRRLNKKVILVQALRGIE